MAAHCILDGNALFTDFKGTLTEQYFMQQLMVKPSLSTIGRQKTHEAKLTS